VDSKAEYWALSSTRSQILQNAIVRRSECSTVGRRLCDICRLRVAGRSASTLLTKYTCVAWTRSVRWSRFLHTAFILSANSYTFAWPLAARPSDLRWRRHSPPPEAWSPCRKLCRAAPLLLSARQVYYRRLTCPADRRERGGRYWETVWARAAVESIFRACSISLRHAVRAARRGLPVVESSLNHEYLSQADYRATPSGRQRSTSAVRQTTPLLRARCWSRTVSRFVLASPVTQLGVRVRQSLHRRGKHFDLSQTPHPYSVAQTRLCTVPEHLNSARITQ